MVMATAKSPKRVLVGVDEVCDGCWVDVYDRPWFAGRLRRFRGPAVFRDTGQAGSIVVGPNASLVNLAGGQRVTLKPKQLVPNLAERPWGKITGFALNKAGEA
jgi:hypothetical protein